MVRTRIEILPDIAGLLDFVDAVPAYAVDMYANKKMKTSPETALSVLKDVLPLLEEHTDYTNDALYAMLSAYVEKTGVKNGFVMWPVRVALSGKQMTPCGATEILELLGKEESLNRIREAINLLS